MSISDWITAIATVVLAFITWYYAKLTKRMLKSTENALAEELRPYVVVDILVENHQIILRIRNIGKRPAFNTIISIEPDVDDIILEVEKTKKKLLNISPFLNQKFISPGYEIKFVLNIGPQYLKIKDSTRNYVYNFSISYSDSSGKLFSNEKCTIDLDNIIYDEKVAIFNNTHYLESINKNLENISKQFNELKSITNSLNKVSDTINRKP